MAPGNTIDIWAIKAENLGKKFWKFIFEASPAWSISVNFIFFFFGMGGWGGGTFKDKNWGAKGRCKNMFLCRGPYYILQNQPILFHQHHPLPPPSLPLSLPSPLPPLSLFPWINGLNLKNLEDNLFRKKSYFTDEIRLYGSYNFLNIFIVCEDASLIYCVVLILLR